MKIVSASKKVLASALSAAMVVAFAPTVAFGKTSGTLTVTFGAGKGSATTAVPSQDGIAFNSDKLTLGKVEQDCVTVYGQKNYTNGNAAFDFWFLDKDNDDVYDNGELKVVHGDSDDTLDVSNLADSESSVELTASYKELSTSVKCDLNTATSGYASKESKTSSIIVKEEGLKPGNYMAVVAINGEKLYSNAKTVTGAESYVNFDAITVDDSKMAAGDVITAYVADVDDNLAEVEGTSAQTHIYTVTCKAGECGLFSDGTSTKTYLVAEDTLKSSLTLEEPSVGSGYSLVKGSEWAQEDGTALPDKVSKDLTLVAQYNNPQVSSLSFTQTLDKNSGEQISKLSYSAANLLDTGDDTDLKAYRITVLKDGTEVFSFENATDISDGTIDDGEGGGVDFAFGADYNTNTGTTAAAAAGTYTVRVEGVYNADTTGENKAFSVEKSVVVDAIVLDANGGKAPTAKEKSKYQIPEAPSLIQAGKSLSDIGFDVDGLKPYYGHKDTYGYTNEDATKEFGGWSVDGVTMADAEKTVAPADGSALTLKALWNTVRVAAPTLDSATLVEDGTYTLKFSCATAGATLMYAIDNKEAKEVPADGIKGVKPTSVVCVLAKSNITSVSSCSEIFIGYDFETYYEYSILSQFDDELAGQILACQTADEQTPKPFYYSEVESVKAAKDAGDAAIKAQGFGTEEQWMNIVFEQYENIMKAVVSYATTQIGDLRTFVKSTDGKTYSKLSDSDYRKALKRLNGVMEEFEEWVKHMEDMGGDVAGVQDKETGGYVEDINAVVTWAKEAAAANTYDAADVEAAQAVTAALQAAKDEPAATAAIESYNKLNDVAKSLVATADVKAACNIIISAKDTTIANKDAEATKQAEEAAAAALEYAEQLAAEQDQTAANLFKEMGKKVVAKAKVGKKAKGKKFTYKLAASASGNEAVFSKTGSNKIKVSAAGKVTFKKVKAAKKAKTYKAKVTVAYGNATQTVTVKYVVKPKKK